MNIKLIKDYITIRKSSSFDREYYKQTYPCVREKKVNPIFHYLRFGWKESKDPSPEFNTEFYLNQYPDVRESGVNPLVHYIRYGEIEGRFSNPSEAAVYQRYLEWVKKFDTLTQLDKDLIQSHISSFEKLPILTIVMVITKEMEISQTIKNAITLVNDQIYTNWQLIILCDDEKRTSLSNELERIEGKDHKIIVHYVKFDKNLASHLNEVLDELNGEFFAKLSPYVYLRAHALYLVANAINEFPEVDVIYGDDDQLNNEEERCKPFFKPDWNPDLFNTQNLFKDFSFFRRDIVKDVGGYEQALGEDLDWDLAFRIIETVPSSHIRHIPHVCADVQYISYVENNERESYHTIMSHFKRTGKNVKLIQTDSPYWRIKYPIPDPNPLVSILIPTKNHPKLLRNCLESILDKTEYSNFEILVINNFSDDPELLTYFTTLTQNEKIKLLHYNHPFNFSAINNSAAEQAKGRVILFLNDDTEVISSDWLTEMVSHSIRAEIGAVGSMLYFPYNQIQHAGIILTSEKIAGHAFCKEARGSYGQNDRARLVQNYSAVTAACLAVEKNKFFEVRGFDEKNLSIGYNDVDLCLKLCEAGYFNLWTPFAELFHFGSASRGPDEADEKQNRLTEEAKFMLEKWGPQLENDPSYHPNFDPDPLFSLAFPPRNKRPWEDRER